ncbi:hypothetical protein L3i22_026080 [Actinoplanes sp. L3-i22]|nr:hypothetical protein L3i22_026080 [Actinoplanes sp. L3-i22]
MGAAARWAAALPIRPAECPPVESPPADVPARGKRARGEPARGERDPTQSQGASHIHYPKNLKITFAACGQPRTVDNPGYRMARTFPCSDCC